MNGLKNARKWSWYHEKVQGLKNTESDSSEVYEVYEKSREKWNEGLKSWIWQHRWLTEPAWCWEEESSVATKEVGDNHDLST